MRLSRYFHELRTEYEAELDDLRTDSEGKPVLDRRLTEKRKAFNALLPMLEVAPVMVVPAFHRAFDFSRADARTLSALLAGEPDRFIAWAELADQIGIADWAQPLVDRVLAEPAGEIFLLTAVGLEFLSRGGAMVAGRAMSAPRASDEEDASEEEDEHRDAGRFDDDGDSRDEGEDNEAMGEDFLEQQGFDRRREL